MGNFDFVRTTLPTVAADCARAESYVLSDPRTACFYSRRAVEGLVGHLYEILDLRAYKDDLAARTNHASFKAQTGDGINAKLNLIRTVANTAVHKSQPIRPDIALQVLRELFHVMVWAAFRHSPNPGAVPTSAQFDANLARSAAPLSREELAALAQRFKDQDETHAAALAAKDDLLATRQAEIEELREQIQAAQAAKTGTDDHDYTETQTRDLFIDVMLGEAGWPLTEVKDREYPVVGMPNAHGNGFVDYVLWGTDGLPLAVVEAKRATHSPAIGQQQAKLYADCLESMTGRRPVVFYTNGYQHWLWDDVAGYPPRQVEGFYTRDELELLVQRRHTRLPLAQTPIESGIADRYYQTRAIRAVGDTFTARQREALLVMATGSGKTRTVIALVDHLMKANWAKRVLFLADRIALVRQAANAFKTHLPSVTTVNLVTEKSTEGRVYVATYPTMMNLINQVDDAGRRFGPGYFDVIVIDEAHRSVYAKYGALFRWFDGLLVGLTATPKDEVDHNTYRLFHLENGVPTDTYSLGDAVADKYLVPPKGVAVGTTFLRQGIKYADLTEEERDQWDTLDWGDDDAPDEVGAEELNRFLFNEDTVDKVLATLMTDGYKVAGGDRLGKTIIFAKNQAHAEFIQQRFDLSWPEYSGHFARVITHSVTYAQSLIDDFSLEPKAPHIAISVDMLDTGIDVPEVVNLVFFKTVRSKSKFWQMIGRGTRLRPDLFGPGQDKQDFLVFDFCGNLEFFSQDLPGSEGSLQKSLTQRIVEARLGLVTLLAAGGTEPDLRATTTASLHEFVAGMTTTNVLVRPHRKAVERFSDRAAWQSLSKDDAETVLGLAGLPSSVRDADEQAKRFDLIILRRQLAQLDGDAVAAERLRETVQAVCHGLLGKTAIPAVAAQAELLEAVADDQWWVDVTLPMLELARLRIRGLVRFVEKTKRNPVYTDFVDTLGDAVDIDLPYTTPGTDIERFRAKAAAYLREHADDLVLQRLRRNRQLTSDDLASLEGLLINAGGHPVDINFVTEQNGGLGLFVRSLVGLDRAAAVEAFSAFLDGSRYSVEQVRFVTLIVDELTTNGVVEPDRLYESPYTDHAPRGPDVIFPSADVVVLANILRRVKSNALPADVA